MNAGTTPESYEIRPSDLSQAVFRVLLVSAVVIWTAVNGQTNSLVDIIREPHFQFAVLYWVISVLMFCWTAYLLARVRPNSLLYQITRVFGIFTDVGAASVYTAISGAAGIILYPVFLTISIGYGYRFGVRYLYAALVVSAVFFGFAVQRNSYIIENTNLILAYYLGIALVPLYSASLLNKHREVLQRLKEVNLARSRFIANMSHELRTPLHAIISVADLLSEDFRERANEVDGTYQKVGMIGDSAHYLLDLVNRVLDIASADAGGVGAAKLATVNLRETIATSLKVCRPNAEGKGLGYYWFYDLELPRYVESSSEHLQEILVNTIGNAVKYTQSGYVYVSAKSVTKKSGKELVLEIADTGIGISSKLLPTIFEPFTLGDDSAGRNYSGTGLGLTLTKQFVENLRGTIEFFSTEGAGTRCIIRLPLASTPIGMALTDHDAAGKVCVLISPRTVRRDELQNFEAVGWCCRVTNKELVTTELLAEASVIFVDSAYLGMLDEITDKLGSLKARRLVVIYDSTSSVRQTERLAINTIVRKGSPADLKAASELAAAMYGVSEEGTKAHANLTDLGIEYVLVADDNPTNLRTARLALENHGLNVTTVDNGDKALTELETNKYNIAFVDLHMPAMSGIEVTQIYQYLLGEFKTPIVILTADATHSAREEALSAGALAVLTKPLRVAELRQAVADYARCAGPHASEHASTKAATETLYPTQIVDESVLQEFLDLEISPDEISIMLDEFLEDGKKLLSELETWIARRDTEKVRYVLHSLKGACGTVGASELFTLLKAAERYSFDELLEDQRLTPQNLASLLDNSSDQLMHLVTSRSSRQRH